MVWLPDYRNPRFIGMSDDALRAKLADLEHQWDVFQSSEHDGGGSPGEWMYEAMGELETELERRTYVR